MSSNDNHLSKEFWIHRKWDLLEIYKKQIIFFDQQIFDASCEVVDFRTGIEGLNHAIPKAPEKPHRVFLLKKQPVDTFIYNKIWVDLKISL